MDHAVLVHVLTKKGKGYAPAEKMPSKFHGVSPFDVQTGEVLSIKKQIHTRMSLQISCVNWVKKSLDLLQLRPQ